MRHRLALLLPLLALAACGRPNFEKADGSFDRAGFRELNARDCANGMRSTNAAIPEQYATRLCGCIIDRLMAGSSDDELRTYHRDDRIPVERLQAATRQCGGPTGPGTPLPSADTPVDERPPPDAAPPSPGDGLPPPVVAPPGTDGPDAGGGIPAPGTVRARARANLGSYFTEDDYPAAALRANQQGRVAFTVDIGPDGRVTRCRITASSGAASLDSATCRIVQSRARYTPARNARGMAVADRGGGSVIWRLPEG